MRSLTATASLFTRISLLKPQTGCNTNGDSDGATPVHALEAGRLRALTDC